MTTTELATQNRYIYIVHLSHSARQFQEADGGDIYDIDNSNSVHSIWDNEDTANKIAGYLKQVYGIKDDFIEDFYEVSVSRSHVNTDRDIRTMKKELKGELWSNTGKETFKE